MTDHLENEIVRILALKAARPIKRIEMLQSLCDTLRGNCSSHGGPIDGEPAGIGCMNWN